MKKLAYLGFLAVLGGALAGCDRGSFADLQAYMDEVRAQPGGKIEQMPKEVIYEPFTYKASGWRSPFQPPLKLDAARQERGRSDIRPDETSGRELLENFNIESFVRVGTLADKGGSFALIRGGDGVHRVRVGDYLGRHHGRIVSITADAVEVLRPVPDRERGWVE